jgi:anti-sigma factor RsiW
VGGVTHQCALGPEDLGPYLLGQLSADDAARVAAALAACPTCTEEVAELLPTVAAMAVTVPDEGHPASLPASSLNQVLDAVDQQRRASTGNRRALLAVAAVVAAVAFALAAGLVIGLDGPRPDGETLRLKSASGASAEVVLDGRSWGTAMALEVSGLDPEVTYGAWLARRDGKRVPAGSFRSNARGWAKVELGGALSRSDCGSLGVATLEGADVLSAKLSIR